MFLYFKIFIVERTWLNILAVSFFFISIVFDRESLLVLKCNHWCFSVVQREVCCLIPSSTSDHKGVSHLMFINLSLIRYVNFCSKFHVQTSRWVFILLLPPGFSLKQSYPLPSALF